MGTEKFNPGGWPHKGLASAKGGGGVITLSVE